MNSISLQFFLALMATFFPKTSPSTNLFYDYPLSLKTGMSFSRNYEVAKQSHVIFISICTAKKKLVKYKRVFKVSQTTLTYPSEVY